MSKHLTVFVHAIVHNGTSDSGNARFRVYSNLGNINMRVDSKIGKEFDATKNLANSRYVGQWVQLTMSGTTFTALEIV